MRWSTWRKGNILRRGMRRCERGCANRKGPSLLDGEAGNGPVDDKELVVGDRGIRLFGHDQAARMGAARLFGSSALTRPIIAPLAKALLGQRKGDVIRAGEGDAEIAKIE